MVEMTETMRRCPHCGALKELPIAHQYCTFCNGRLNDFDKSLGATVFRDVQFRISGGESGYAIEYDKGILKYRKTVAPADSPYENVDYDYKVLDLRDKRAEIEQMLETFGNEFGDFVIEEDLCPGATYQVCKLVIDNECKLDCFCRFGCVEDDNKRNEYAFYYMEQEMISIIKANDITFGEVDDQRQKPVFPQKPQKYSQEPTQKPKKDKNYYEKILKISCAITLLLGLVLVIYPTLITFIPVLISCLISFATIFIWIIVNDREEKAELKFDDTPKTLGDPNCFSKYVEGPTPNGAYAIMYYYDANDNPCTIDNAVKISIDEFDKDGKCVYNTLQYRTN